MWRPTPNLRPRMNRVNITTKDLNELSNADVIVAYLGEPSLGVGAELVIAMQQNKTILAVYECRRKILRFVRGLLRSHENASLYEFASPSEACGWITDTLLARLSKIRLGETPEFSLG